VANPRQPPSSLRRPPARTNAFPLDNFRWNDRPTSQTFNGLKKITRSRSQHLLEAACKVVNASFSGLGFLSATGDLVENPAWGLSEEVADGLSGSPWLAELIRVVLEQPGPLRLADLARACPFEEVPPALPPQGALLAMPLARPGRLRGVLYLVRAPGQPAFTAEDEERILPLCACLEQGSLFEEAHLQAQLRLLTQVAQAAAGNLDLAPILDVALRELDRNLPMTICAVWLAETTPQDQAPVEGTADEAVHLRLAATSAGHSSLARQAGLTPGMRLALLQTPFTPCWKEGGAIYTDWTRPSQAPAAPSEAAPAAVGLHAATPGTTTCFGTPLRAGDQTVGILQCLTNRPSGFTSEQVQILYLVADLLGPAISNCQLHGRLRTTYEELRATQEQLIRNEKMRAIGELASGMAHDFNNSLCGVLGFLEMTLMDRGLSSSSRGHLDLARTCALDAAQTVRRVQDFARASRQEANFQVLDVNQLVHETVELTRPKWESLERSRGIPILLQVQTRAASPVQGNAAELREALTNLVFNAADAMPQGGTLTVQAWSDARDVFLAVRDTGVGMSLAVRQRLFEPFFTTKGERGNGLGLSVTFGIVRQHGGDITVASEVGQGSVFTIRLPAACASESGLDPSLRSPASRGPGEPSAPSASASALAAGSASGLTGLRILVVEDEDPICRMLETVLTTLGHRPHVVQTATAALQVFAADSFDVVLTDMGLPDLSGEEVARTVAERAPGFPVVLLTGWADQIRSEAKSLPGVTQLLGKPVTVARLAEALRGFRPRG
jgi:signal transduction histidine kinase